MATKREEQINQELKSRNEAPHFNAGFVEGAQWADEHPHWISVEDEGNPKYIGWHIFATGKIIDVGYYLGDNEWIGVRPTHWMPLPPPPQKGGEK